MVTNDLPNAHKPSSFTMHHVIQVFSLVSSLFDVVYASLHCFHQEWAIIRMVNSWVWFLQPDNNLLSGPTFRRCQNNFATAITSDELKHHTMTGK